MRWTLLFLLLPALLACAPGNDPTDGGPDDEVLDVSGDWTEEWSCDTTCTGVPDETITGVTSMTLTQDGDSVERVDGDGTTWSGTLSASTLNISTSDGYTEDSIFEFTVEDDGTTNSFTVTSEYEDADCTGVCTGTGERD
jgi:hypothetical protein